MEAEFEKLLSGASKKRPAESQLGQEAKKRRTEVPRPSWVVDNNSSARLAAALDVAEAGSGRGGHGEETEASVVDSEVAGEATKCNSMPALLSSL